MVFVIIFVLLLTSDMCVYYKDEFLFFVTCLPLMTGLNIILCYQIFSSFMILMTTLYAVTVMNLPCFLWICS